MRAPAQSDAAERIINISIEKGIAALPGWGCVHRQGHGKRRASAMRPLAAWSNACRIIAFWRLTAFYSCAATRCCCGSPRDRPTSARDAIDLIDVEYDVLTAVADPEKALAPALPVRASRMA